MNDCNNTATPYTIEKLASDRPLADYVVGRIYQLEAQVEDQKNHIVQLEKAVNRYASDYRELMEILKPEVKLTDEGEMRKIVIDGTSIEYCKYARYNYHKLVSLLGLQKENYQACMQEYENEILNGTKTDLSNDERAVAKAAYEAKSKSEGDDSNAD